MGINVLVKKIFTSLGENNNAVYTVIAIAIAKGTLRPIFTMMDKKQDLETRRYAAFREGTTEAIAVPTYLASGLIANKLAPKFLNKSLVKVGSEKDNNVLNLTDKYRHEFDNILKIKKDLKKQSKSDEEIKKVFDTAIEKLGKQETELFEVYKSKLKVVKATTSFTGVCLAALAIIPATCNVVLPPIMKRFKSLQKNKNITTPAVSVCTKNTSQPLKSNNKPKVANFNSTNLLNTYLGAKTNSGMKVGM